MAPRYSDHQPAALRLDAQRLPIPRADGDREALRILLGARRELTAGKTRMVNRLRALLLTGDNVDRILARGSMSPPRLDLDRPPPRNLSSFDATAPAQALPRAQHYQAEHPNVREVTPRRRAVVPVV